MGFTSNSMNKTLRNFSKFGAEAIEQIVEAIEVIQNEAVTHAKTDHFAPTIKIKGKRKKKKLPSLGGENRVWNLDGTPRYGDISGKLTSSVKAQRIKAKGNFIRGKVFAGTGVNVNYAAAVEFGGTVARGGSKRAGSQIVLGLRKPHPFMAPALRHAQKYERDHKTFATALKDAMRSIPSG